MSRTILTPEQLRAVSHFFDTLRNFVGLRPEAYPDNLGAQLAELLAGASSLAEATTATLPSSPDPGDIVYNTDLNEIQYWNGTEWTTPSSGGGNVDRVVSTIDRLLTTTSPTTIATYSPSVTGNYLCFIYYRVVNTTTSVTLTISWSDGSGSQTMTVLPTTSTNVGSYSLSPVYITAVPAVITITAATGIASNLYASTSIVSL